MPARRTNSKSIVRLWSVLPLLAVSLVRCGERAPGTHAGSTVPPLQVESRLPEGDAGSRGTVTVVFDRPVTALGAGDPTVAAGRRWLVLEPETPGVYHWVGTRTLCFTAPGGLPAATPFRVRVPAGVKSVDGAVLARDVEWRFTTPRPSLVASVPAAGDSLARPADPFVLLFNLAVEPSAVARAAALEPGTSWTADRPDSALLRQLDPRFWGVPFERMVRLVPAPALRPDHAYTLQLASTLRARVGSLGLEQPVEVAFRTHGKPGFVQAASSGPGGAVLRFRTPVDPDSARAYLQFDPPPPSLELWQNGNAIQVFGALGYRRTVTVTARAGLPDLFGQRLLAAETHTFTTGDREPTLQLLPRDAVLLPAAARTVALVSCGMGAIRVQARRLSVRDEIRARTEPQRTVAYTFEQKIPAPADANEINNREVDLSTLVPKSGRGAVLVRARSKIGDGEWDERTVLRWSDLGLAVKASADNGVAWTTHLGTAKPWAAVALTLLDAGGAVVWSGRTDARGLAVLPGLRVLGRDAWQLHLVAAAAGDSTVTPLQGDWRLDPWRFDIPGTYGTPPREERAFLWSDRDVYRPGETARVAGWIRRFAARGLQSAALDSVMVQVRDPMGRDAFLQRVPVDGAGGFAFDVENKRGAPLGRYGVDAFVEVSRQDRRDRRERHSLGSLGYEVAAFRAPAFRTTVTPRTRHVFAGGTLESAVAAAYYFGAPIAAGTFRWTVVRQRYAYTPRGFEEFSFTDPELEFSYGGLLGSGAGVLDDGGKGAVRLALPPEMPGVTQALHLEAAVRDASGDEVNGHTSWLFHPAPVYAGVAVQPQFVPAGDSVQVRVVAVRADTAVAAPGTPLRIEVVRREWRAVRKLLVGGRIGYETAQRDSVVEVRQAVAGAGPVAVSIAPALPGSYRVRVQAPAAAPSAVPGPWAVAWFYVSGASDGAWRPSDAVRLELATDRAAYHEGDVARILLSTPVHADRALLTIEREGLLESRIVDLSAGARVFEVPVKPEYLPNVYVGLAAVEPALTAKQAPALPEVARLPRYVVGYVPLRVDVEARRVAVEVQPDRAEYGPGERAKIGVQLRDAQGAAVRGRVAIAVVDEAVLALLGTPVPDPFAFFYSQRALGVANNDTRLRLSAGSRLESAAFKAEAGGDGGEQLAARSLFTTTAYWNPAVVAGADGRAQVEFQWPDNLTRFRIVALAASGNDRFGAGRAEVTVTKPLTIELALPRFVMLGDTLEAACVVTHRGSTRQQGEVVFGGELELLQKPRQTLDLVPGESRRLAFRVRARASGTARVRVDVRLGTARDAVEVRLPVVEPTVPRTAATAVHLEPAVGDGLAGANGVARATESVAFPPRALGPPRLEVTLGTSALAGARPAFEYVLDYPFECLEQRASRLLVLTLGRELFGADADAVADSARIRVQIESTVRALERMATPWGGFAYWEGGAEAPPWMQAWAVLALSRAQAAGFNASPNVLQNAAWQVARTLREGPAGAAWRTERNGGARHDTAAFEAQWWRELTAGFGLFALSPVLRPQAGSPLEPSDVDALVDHLDRLGPEEQQFLALALQAWSLRPEVTERVLRRTLERAEVSAEFAQLAPPDDPARAAEFRTPARATSMALLVTTAVRPADPLAAKLASGLLRLRTRGHWSTMQDDALALLALDAYRTRVEKPAGAVDVRAVLRETGTVIAVLAADGRALRVTTGAVDLPGGPAPRPLTLAYEGAGPLHAAATLRWNEDVRSAPPQESGFVLQRRIERYEGRAPLRVGDLVVVTLNAVIPRPAQYLALVDPLPAGLEIVQSEFRTESQQVAHAAAAWGAAYDALPVTHTERDDRELRVFADAVPPGVYTHRYVARVRAAGRFTVPPARLAAMYSPELQASTASSRLVALPPEPAAPPKKGAPGKPAAPPKKAPRTEPPGPPTKGR